MLQAHVWLTHLELVRCAAPPRQVVQRLGRHVLRRAPQCNTAYTCPQVKCGISGSSHSHCTLVSCRRAGSSQQSVVRRAPSSAVVCACPKSMSLMMPPAPGTLSHMNKLAAVMSPCAKQRPCIWASACMHRASNCNGVRALLMPWSTHCRWQPHRQQLHGEVRHGSGALLKRHPGLDQVIKNVRHGLALQQPAHTPACLRGTIAQQRAGGDAIYPGVGAHSVERKQAREAMMWPR